VYFKTEATKKTPERRSKIAVIYLAIHKMLLPKFHEFIFLLNKFASVFSKDPTTAKMRRNA